MLCVMNLGLHGAMVSLCSSAASYVVGSRQVLQVS